ncbi:uncharacterized protein LOC142905680 [Petromyzon marinus]|uniref:uncharacterized protein LOC142905680 n=1 Tax=Petromyzon marinus TaxID=7757 RepID=UPI003F700CC7
MQPGQKPALVFHTLRLIPASLSSRRAAAAAERGTKTRGPDASGTPAPATGGVDGDRAPGGGGRGDLRSALTDLQQHILVLCQQNQELRNSQARPGAPDEPTAGGAELVPKSELDSRIAELESRRRELESRESELGAARGQLRAVETEVESLRAELESARVELRAKDTELSRVEAELGSLRAELECARSAGALTAAKAATAKRVTWEIPEITETADDDESDEADADAVSDSDLESNFLRFTSKASSARRKQGTWLS